MKSLARLVAGMVVMGLLASCAPLSKEIMSQVDESLTYPVVQQDPDRYKGKTVLWGGVIAQTTNRQNETALTVTQTELDLEKRPKNLDRSAGRFIVRYPGFLDPNIFKEGREITVAGDVGGKEVLPLGGIQYAYPVIMAREIHLWEKPQPISPYYYYPYDPFWDYPFWWGPYRYPYRWHRPYW